MFISAATTLFLVTEAILRCHVVVVAKLQNCRVPSFAAVSTKWVKPHEGLEHCKWNSEEI